MGRQPAYISSAHDQRSGQSCAKFSTGFLSLIALFHTLHSILPLWLQVTIMNHQDQESQSSVEGAAAYILTPQSTDSEQVPDGQTDAEVNQLIQDASFAIRFPGTSENIRPGSAIGIQCRIVTTRRPIYVNLHVTLMTFAWIASLLKRSTLSLVAASKTYKSGSGGFLGTIQRPRLSFKCLGDFSYSPGMTALPSLIMKQPSCTFLERRSVSW